MKKWMGWSSLVMMVSLLVACAGHVKYPLSGSSTVPAATGTVTVEDRDKPNRTLKIRVEHLAKPESLAGAAGGPNVPRTYIVWLQAIGDNTPENVGVLNPNDNLEAELVTKTAQKTFQVFVTAEPSPTQNVPTGEHL